MAKLVIVRETLLMRSESEKTNSKVQREKDVFFSAGQNTTFLAGPGRTVCPLWQYPARLDVHKCVFTCSLVWLHNLSPREFGKKDIWENLETAQSAACCFSHTTSSTFWSHWPLGKHPKKSPSVLLRDPAGPLGDAAGSASVASLYHRPLSSSSGHLRTLNQPRGQTFPPSLPNYDSEPLPKASGKRFTCQRLFLTNNLFAVWLLPELDLLFQRPSPPENTV